MIKGSYKIWEAAILIISALLMLVFWILAELTPVEIPRKIAAVVFGVMALGFFPRPIWLLTHIRKFTERAEALAVKCVSEHVGRSHFRICTLNYSDSAGKTYEASSSSGAFMFSKEGKRYKIRFKKDDPTDFIAVPYAYFEAALFAFLGIAVEALLVLVIVKARN